jgi:hypothetical protein
MPHTPCAPLDVSVTRRWSLGYFTITRHPGWCSSSLGAIAVAQEQYTSLRTGLHAVGQVKGWKVQQLVFVGGTCGSVQVGSFNKNMKALGVLESKWDLIRQKLVRRLLEEQDKVLRSYFAQKGGARSQRGEGIQGKGREHVKWDMYA